MHHWLCDDRFMGTPLFISRMRLERQWLRRAKTEWCLDSGGFSEVSAHGQFTIGRAAYADFIQRCADEIGMLQWAAPMDWMCEPFILAKTGLTIREHQRLTVENFVYLRDKCGDVVIPVLQGWALEDYFICMELYREYGMDLTTEKIVGVGSVCRRQGTDQIRELVMALSTTGINIHCFGMKTKGLANLKPFIKSSDSMSWSLHARKRPPMVGHTHKSCGNCPEYALAWRKNLLQELEIEN